MKATPLPLRDYETVAADQPLRLTSEFLRCDYRRNWPLDLLVMTLTRDDARRLVKAYERTLALRRELVAEGILVWRKNYVPRIEIPVELTMHLHRAEAAEAVGWDVRTDPWSALPAAFDLALLGPAGAGAGTEVHLVSIVQLCERFEAAMLRVDFLGERMEDMPETVFAAELEMRELKEWAEGKEWSGELCLKSGVGFAEEEPENDEGEPTNHLAGV